MALEDEEAGGSLWRARERVEVEELLLRTREDEDAETPLGMAGEDEEALWRVCKEVEVEETEMTREDEEEVEVKEVTAKMLGTNIA